MTAGELLGLAADLARRGEAFALATVVRCEPPTSAKPGARALIRADGTVCGWIGGSCAEPVTVKEALGSLRDGEPRLLALVGADGTPPPSREGVREYAMACHSGGTLEIYVEPVLPKPQLVVVGSGPAVATLATLAAAVGFAVTGVERETGTAPLPEGIAVVDDLAGATVDARTAIVVATHGRFDEDALDWALRTDAGYVGLVASRTRAAAVLQALEARGVPADRLGRLRAPVGIGLGAVTPEEIAVSVLAALVQARRSRPADSRSDATAGEPVTPAEARDPICGMTVAIAGARHTSEADGRRYYFCCAGCKQRFDAQPARDGAAPA